MGGGGGEERLKTLNSQRTSWLGGGGGVPNSLFLVQLDLGSDAVDDSLLWVINNKHSPSPRRRVSGTFCTPSPLTPLTHGAMPPLPTGCKPSVTMTRSWHARTPKHKHNPRHQELKGPPVEGDVTVCSQTRPRRATVGSASR